MIKPIDPAEAAKERHDFGEAVADIARNFAHAQLIPEDSREFASKCVEWAEIFQKKNAGREWDGEYIEEIDAFFDEQYKAWENGREPSRQNHMLIDEPSRYHILPCVEDKEGNVSRPKNGQRPKFWGLYRIIRGLDRHIMDYSTKAIAEKALLRIVQTV